MISYNNYISIFISLITAIYFLFFSSLLAKIEQWGREHLGNFFKVTIVLVDRTYWKVKDRDIPVIKKYLIELLQPIFLLFVSLTPLLLFVGLLILGW